MTKSKKAIDPVSFDFLTAVPEGRVQGKITPNINPNEKVKKGPKGPESNSAKAHETGTAGESINRTGPGQNLVAERTKKYRGRRADFDPFAASIFAPHIFTGRERARAGCGAVALACLTGAVPEKIAAKHRGRHYSDRFMVRFLKRRGFRVMRLSPLRIASARNKVGSEHVILVSQLLYDYTASWGVIFDSLFLHNFKIYDLSTLALLNKPIISAYLVVHPSWRIPDAHAGSRPGPPRRLAGPPFKVSNLRKGAEFSTLREWA